MRNPFEHIKRLDLAKIFSPNVYVQALTLASGLLVAFLFPVLFGVISYGELLKSILPTLVVHRIVDAMSEALIPELAGDEIFAASLAAGVITGSLFVATLHLLGLQQVNPILLTAMVITSAASIAMYRNGLTGKIVVFLAIFCVVFCCLSAFEYMGWPIGLENILILTNSIGAAIAIAMLASHGLVIPSSRRLLSHIGEGMRRIPASFSSTMMMNTISVGYLWIAAPLISALYIGQLRVLTSVVQASISLFPISLKAIFVRFTDRDRQPIEILTLLSAAFWFFIVVFFALQAVGVIVPGIASLANLFLVAIPFFWGACLERLAQTTERRNLYRLLNVVLCLVTLAVAYCTSRAGVVVLGYVGTICLYCMVLACVFIEGLRVIRILAIVALVGLSTSMVVIGVIEPWAAGLVVILAGALLLPPSRAFIGFYRGHI